MVLWIRVYKHNNRNGGIALKHDRRVCGLSGLKGLKSGIAIALIVAIAHPALAESSTDFSTMSGNIVESVSDVPGVISGLSYLLGIILGVMAIIKIRYHVEDPRSTPLREPLVRALAAGALFALPDVYEAVQTTIDGGVLADGITGTIQATSQAMAVTGANSGTGNDLNAVFSNIVTSLEDTPSLFAAVGYLLGLVFGVNGVLTLKEHVQEPERVPVRHGLSKLLVAGCLFAMTTVISAVWSTISAGAGAGDNLSNLIGNMGSSIEAHGQTCSAGATDLGGVICNLYVHTTAFPAFVAATCYIFGVVLVIWGILKLRSHVHEPNQHTVWEGVSRLAAAGGFFSLPYVVEAVMTSMMSGLSNHSNSGTKGTATGAGLDKMLTDFMASVFGPMDIILTFFGYAAGTVLVMVGISRLMKGANEGPRGPGGIGTIMTFITAGALLSFSPMIAALTMSLFGTSTTMTQPELTYTAGLGTDEQQHIVAVISAMIQFVLLLGLISVLRGIFIIRSVAEGGGQHGSMMSGMTHLIGGALAVNLGPFINAVEATLGLSGYGVSFGMGSSSGIGHM